MLDHLELADALANRFRGTGADHRELRQVAYLGLVKAVQRFDPRTGTSLVAFAVPTILGELKRHLRDTSWAVRPPRALQELALEALDLAEELVQQRGTVTTRELARELRVPERRVEEALRCAEHRRALSIDVPVSASDGGPGAVLGDTIPAETDAMEQAELRLLLAPALRDLSDTERRIVDLRFAQDRTQAEIAEVIGVSQMQVSRLLSRILAVLRAKLSAAD